MSPSAEELAPASPVRWCRHCQTVGLQVRIEPEHQRIVMPVNDFAGAVTMPGLLGERVRELLERPGPIMTHPRSDSWTFLSGTHDDWSASLDVYAELFRVYVRVAPRGAMVALPSPADTEQRFRAWLVEPAGEMPTMRELLTAVRAAAQERA